MNYIRGAIEGIESMETLNLVRFSVGSEQLKMISLELDEQMVEGAEVLLGAKATNIAIAKDIQGELSISNQLHSRVLSLQMGKLLCKVDFEYMGQKLQSVITRDSALRMQLQSGDQIIALIKSSELSVVEFVG